MSISDRLTKEQQKQVAAEQQRYDAAKAAAAKAGQEFDPLNDAPTWKDPKNDPVQAAINKIWSGKDR